MAKRRMTEDRQDHGQKNNGRIQTRLWPKEEWHTRPWQKEDLSFLCIFYEPVYKYY